MNQDERTPHALLCRWLAGTLSPEECSRLADLARHDARLRAEMASLLAVERLLRQNGIAGETQDPFATEVVARLHGNPATSREWADQVIRRIQSETANRAIEPEPVKQAPLRKSRARWFAAAAAVILAGVIATGLFSFGKMKGQTALITGLEAAVWSPGQTPLRVGQAPPGGAVDILSGFVHVRFPSGATVLLEGPAGLKLLGPNRARVEHGKALADVPPAATGFVMESPDARILDLGTRFGVRVGKGTELHVLEGKVETTSKGQSVAQPMAESQAALISESGMLALPADETLFLSELPPLRLGPVRYAHWSFDEGRGLTARSEGHLASRESDAVLTSEDAIHPPVWVPGRFGTGLQFDGAFGFVTTGFKGIGGGRPRTVALWVRVPVDWEPKNGFALVSWGTHSLTGGVWQISINPEQKEGPLGRLRVGVQGAQVIGSRDLRDGEWHHVAAVLYHGRDAAPTTTQILLYVDGQLEPAERRAVLAVQTRIDDATALTVRFGRNSDAYPTTGRTLFRGVIDEVFIADAALTQAEIRRLATDNQLPKVERLASR